MTLSSHRSKKSRTLSHRSSWSHHPRLTNIFERSLCQHYGNPKVAKILGQMQPKTHGPNYGRSTLPSLQGDGKTRLDALQSKLRENLGSKLAVDLEQHAQAAIKAATASSSSGNGQHEHRLKALEVGLQELQGQNAQFTTWFPTGGRQIAKYRGHNGCHAADREHPST